MDPSMEIKIIQTGWNYKTLKKLYTNDFSYTYDISSFSSLPLHRILNPDLRERPTPISLYQEED